MGNQRRKVLLMVDNASSHCITGMVLRSVKLLYLPLNTTSKLQPLDTGIIAALKRRYRHRQLQAALDKEKEGIQRDIYAVDQLTAMKWAKGCWRDIYKELVLNCFRHTAIVLGKTSSVRSKKETDALVHGELLVEENTEMGTLSVEEVLNETTDSTFLDTAEGDSLEEDDDNVEDEDFMQISPEDKVIAVRNVIALLVDHPDHEERLLKDLRKVQTRRRDELRIAIANRTKQTSIGGFFSRRR